MALSKGSKTFLGVIVALAALAAAGLFGVGLLAGGGETGPPVTVEIPEGAGPAMVADILDEEGVIRWPFAFRLGVRFDGRAGQIQPGIYELTPGMSTGAIMDIIAQPGAPDAFRVTIPEGLTVEQTLARVAEADGSPFDAEELEDALSAVALPAFVPDLPEGADPYEGLLFPDTYEFPLHVEAQDVVARMVAETEAVLDGVDPPQDFDAYEVLIIASLVEREARVAEERPVVASVIYNRLAEPMRLQVDATVQYARGEHTDRVLFADLGIESLWNTYEHDGLPPTPISGVGRAAVEAAADPAETEYLYYVVEDLETGEHAFAETLPEHNENVARYRQLRAEAEAEADADGEE